MEQLQEIISVLFGDSVTVADICSMISVILVPILTAFFNHLKNKLVAAESSSATKDAQISELESKLENTQKCVSYLSDMMINVYMTSNTISDERKKLISNYASKIDNLAGVELTKNTETLIEEVKAYVPDLNDKKEEILKATAEAEQVIDDTNDATQAAIDKLKL